MFFSADRVASVYNVGVGNVWIFSVPPLFFFPLLFLLFLLLSLFPFIAALVNCHALSCQSQGSVNCFLGINRDSGDNDPLEYKKEQYEAEDNS